MTRVIQSDNKNSHSNKIHTSLVCQARFGGESRWNSVACLRVYPSRDWKEGIAIHIISLIELVLFDFHNIKKPTLCLKCRHRLRQDLADQAIPRRRQHLIIGYTNLSRRIAVRPAEREDVNEKQINQRHPYFSHSLKDVTNILQTRELTFEIRLNVK